MISSRTRASSKETQAQAVKEVVAKSQTLPPVPTTTASTTARPSKFDLVSRGLHAQPLLMVR